MKNHAIASSLIEALNSADVSNEMATTVSDMLVSIEKKRVLKSKKSKNEKKGKKTLSNKIEVKNVIHDALNILDNEERKKRIERHRKNIEERPYFYSSLDDLVVMREKMKNEKNKYENKNNLTPNVKYVRKIVSCRNILSTISNEITLKVEEYKLKGRSIPRSLLVNDGFILSDEAIKRDEQRRKMIEDEAKVDLRLREAIANRFSTQLEYPIESKLKNNTNKPTLDYSSLNSNIRSSESLDKKIVNDFFDGKLYQYLIRTINKNDAWKICKDRELSELYKKSPFDPMGFSYFNSVCYRAMINCGIASHDANLISTNRDESERYLREYISINTKNKLKRENYVHSVKKEKRIRNIVQLDEVFDEGILRENLLIRTPALQLDPKYRVLDNFYYTCAVTGQKIPALLQACHIGDYSMTRSMSTSNGILLVSDCHNLFDNNLMGIEPERLTVHFNVKCIYADLFEGREISKHKYQLDKKYLLLKWDLFNSNKNI